MNKVLWLMVAAALLGFACGGGGSSDRPDAALGDRSADEVAASTLAAMGAVESYHQDLTFVFSDSEAGWQLDFAGADRYRHAAFNDDARVFELIVADDAAYGRFCADIGKGCGEWERGDVPELLSIGRSGGRSASELPGWPLVALEQAEFASAMEEDGRIRLRGTVNSLRAVLEHQRRTYTEAAISSFGEECTNGECRDTTFEDLLAQEADELEYYDANPSAIDVWVDGDSLVERMEIRIEASPADEPGAGVTVMVEYSNFNAVVVEAPE